MDVNCLDFPTSYLNTLRGGQQRPGEVGVIQAVELSRWLYTFHVKAVASKDIDGISLFMVDCRVAIQTWFKNKASKIGLCAMKRVFRAIFVSLKKIFFTMWFCIVITISGASVSYWHYERLQKPVGGVPVWGAMVQFPDWGLNSSKWWLKPFSGE